MTDPAASAYRRAGVDIAAGDHAVDLMKAAVRATFGPEVLTDLGHFSGLYALAPRLGAPPGGDEPVLVASADGVGTKLRLAIALDQHGTVGQDLVNHCVNDILTCGARPLFFLDYFATGRLDPEQVATVVSGLAAGCRAAGAALLGGETAEMPGFYAAGDYDLAGFIVGLVDRRRMVLGTAIAPGNVVLGLPAAGLHTNGYSLARQALGLNDPDPAVVRARLAAVEPALGRPLGAVLLAPHRCYLPAVAPLLDADPPVLKGMAHITGGGLYGNIARILPAGTQVRLTWGSWPRPPIFDLIAARGAVAPAEMPHVFNMGLGYVLIAAAGDVEWVRAAVPEALVVGAVGSRDAGPAVVIVGIDTHPDSATP